MILQTAVGDVGAAVDDVGAVVGDVCAVVGDVGADVRDVGTMAGVIDVVGTVVCVVGDVVGGVKAVLRSKVDRVGLETGDIEVTSMSCVGSAVDDASAMGDRVRLVVGTSVVAAVGIGVGDVVVLVGERVVVLTSVLAVGDMCDVEGSVWWWLTKSRENM